MRASALGLVGITAITTSLPVALGDVAGIEQGESAPAVSQSQRELEVYYSGSPLIDSITGEVIEYSDSRQRAISNDVNQITVKSSLPPLSSSTSTMTPSSSKNLAPLTVGTVCRGTWFRPRGFNLYPGFSADTKKIYFDPTGNWRDGYELRRVLGMECFGDFANWNVPSSNVFKGSSSLTEFGSQLLMTNGQVYEGCYWISPNNSYNCDFKIDGAPSKLTPSVSSEYWWMVLKNWSYYQAQFLIDCGGNLIGGWNQTSTLADITNSCIEYGPFNP